MTRLSSALNGLFIGGVVAAAMDPPILPSTGCIAPQGGPGGPSLVTCSEPIVTPSPSVSGGSGQSSAGSSGSPSESNHPSSSQTGSSTTSRSTGASSGPNQPSSSKSGTSTAPGSTSASQTGGASITSSASSTGNIPGAPFVVGGSITMPAQTGTASGEFAAKTLTGPIGPPHSYSQTTTTGSDQKPTILPIWFDLGGLPVINIPLCLLCPLSGSVPPPPGLGPPLAIGSNGVSQPFPNNEPDPNHPSAPSGSVLPTTQQATQQATQEASSSSTSSSSSSSSSSASAAPTVYLVIPQRTASQSDTDKIKDELVAQNGQQNVSTYPEGAKTGIRYMATVLNDTQLKTVRSNKAVQWVIPNNVAELAAGRQTKPRRRSRRSDAGNTTRIDKRALTSEDDADWALATISEPRSGNKDPNNLKYEYDDLAGAGVTVYVVDTGATPEAPEYKLMPGAKEWILPVANPLLESHLRGNGYDPIGGNDQQDDWDDDDSHGTCALSKVSGKKYGVAKAVDVVIVKMMSYLQPPKDGRRSRGLSYASLLQALWQVKEDFDQKNKDKKLEGKAVVALTAGLQSGVDGDIDDAIRSAIQDFTKAGIPVVAALGNQDLFDSSTKEVKEYPAILGKSDRGVIAVGASTKDGRELAINKVADWVKLFAPGEDVKCASKKAEDGYEQTQYGTSFAAPAAAGLAAYEMALGRRDADHPLHDFDATTFAAKVHDVLISQAWSRKDQNGPVISNQKCGSSNARRDGGSGSNVCARPSPATTMQTSTTSPPKPSSNPPGPASNPPGPVSCPPDGSDCSACPHGKKKGSCYGSLGWQYGGWKVDCLCKDPCGETKCVWDSE